MSVYTITSDPVFAVNNDNLVPVGDFLKKLAPIPPSKMFLIDRKSVV
jgi:hypothetical protein